MNKGISETKVDYNQFWKIIFGNRAEVFSNLLTNYLLKIKIHHFDDINSGYQAGQLVNTILENMFEESFWMKINHEIGHIIDIWRDMQR